MIYCMADIHGEIDRYHKMLEKIKFSTDDTLYIIGDVVDRNSGGLDIIKEIMNDPNIKFILGNHEHMLLDVLGPCPLYCSKSAWFDRGGEPTYNQWTWMTDPDTKKEIMEFLLSAPDHIDIEVNGKQFHLVHGFPGDNTFDRVWERTIDHPDVEFNDKTVIIGHTPTCMITEDLSHKLKMYHGAGYIDIDCGCGYEIPVKRLACLRLDDMREFYV